MNAFLHGVWPACPTMLTDGEDLDEPAMRRVVRFLVEAKVDGLWLFGGGGEGVLLTNEVRRNAAEVVLDEVAEAIPVLAGVSAEGTRRALSRFRPFADLPIAGIFATPPFYYVCTPQELVSFYRDVARETGRPVVAYNNPHVAKVAIEPAIAAVLSEIDGVIGLKDSSGDFLVTQSLLQVTLAKPGFAVLQGYDQLAAPSLLAGAAGCVTAVGGFAPHMFVELAAAAHSGDAERALELQRDVLDLLDLLAWDPYSDSAFIRGVKTCLSVLGVADSAVAHPFEGADANEREAIEAALRRTPALSRS